MSVGVGTHPSLVPDSNPGPTVQESRAMWSIAFRTFVPAWIVSMCPIARVLLLGNIVIAIMSLRAKLDNSFWLESSLTKWVRHTSFVQCNVIDEVLRKISSVCFYLWQWRSGQLFLISVCLNCILFYPWKTVVSVVFILRYPGKLHWRRSCDSKASNSTQNIYITIRIKLIWKY